MDTSWQQYSVAIAITSNHDVVDRGLMTNILQLVKPPVYSILIEGEHIKSASLNKLALEAGRRNYQKILFLDADMHFPEWTIPKLLSHNLPIVSGLYHMKQFPYSPIAGWRSSEGNCVNGDGKMWKENYCPLPRNQLVEVDWVGVGCLLVDMDVFNKIYFPCFKDIWSDEMGSREKGHDVLFCETAKAAGYKVYVDTEVDCSHKSTLYVNKLYIDAYYKVDFQGVLVSQLNQYSYEHTYWDEMWAGYRHRRKLRNIESLTREGLQPLIPAGAPVADLGCGCGGMLMILQKDHKCEVMGYDFSQESIDYLAEKGTPGKVADLRTYEPDKDEEKKYHTVILSHILEHLDDEGMAHALDVAERMACEQVLVVVPGGETARWYEHYRNFTDESLVEVLRPRFPEVEIRPQVPYAIMTPSSGKYHIIARCIVGNGKVRSVIDG